MSTILIIPYRDREEHLKYFKNNAIPLLKKYIPDIKNFSSGNKSWANLSIEENF